MTLLECLEFASYPVTVIALPFAIIVFIAEQRERMLVLFDILISLFERAYIERLAREEALGR